MVVPLTGFMLDEGATMLALIVLAVAVVMIVMPPLQKLMAARRAGEGRGKTLGGDVGDAAAGGGRRAPEPSGSV